MNATHEAVGGLSEKPVSALRYNSRINNKYENTGILISLISENSRLLDIGCGTGSITGVLAAARGLSVLGVEPHPERAEQARAEGFEVVTGLYSDDIPAKHGKFDYVLFADVLEHLVDPGDMLAQVKGALAPGGRVLASIPNVAHWTVRARLLMGDFDYTQTGLMDATHLRWFTRKSVVRLFESSGYEVEHIGAAAGGWMHQYARTPLRFLTQDQRSYVLGQACRVAPGFFGVQHVVSARLR